MAGVKQTILDSKIEYFSNSNEKTWCENHKSAIIAFHCDNSYTVLPDSFSCAYRGLGHETSCCYAVISMTSFLFSTTDDFPQDTLNYLSQRGHKMERIQLVGVVQGIAVDKEGNVEAYADPRKDGKEGHAVVVQRT